MDSHFSANLFNSRRFCAQLRVHVSFEQTISTLLRWTIRITQIIIWSNLMSARRDARNVVEIFVTSFKQCEMLISNKRLFHKKSTTMRHWYLLLKGGGVVKKRSFTKENSWMLAFHSQLPLTLVCQWLLSDTYQSAGANQTVPWWPKKYVTTSLSSSSSAPSLTSQDSLNSHQTLTRMVFGKALLTQTYERIHSTSRCTLCGSDWSWLLRCPSS